MQRHADFNRINKFRCQLSTNRKSTHVLKANQVIINAAIVDLVRKYALDLRGGSLVATRINLRALPFFGAYLSSNIGKEKSTWPFFF